MNLRLLCLVLITLSLLGTPKPIVAAASKTCVVAIDIGHSPSAPGATSARGVQELTFNRNFAKILLERIRKDGVARAFIVDSTGLSLEQRTESAKRQNASLLISIHHDSVQPSYLSNWTYQGGAHHFSDRFHGFSLFVSTRNPRSEASLRLAQDIGYHLLEAGFTPTLHHAEHIRGENRRLVDRKRGIYVFDDLIVLKTATMPAVLLECGVIVNRKEERRLTNRTDQDRMAEAVAAGIEQECNALINASQ